MSASEQLAEIRQYLADEANTCMYTNYHFEVGGTRAKEDKPTLLESIPGLADGMDLVMVEGTILFDTPFYGNENLSRSA